MHCTHCGTRLLEGKRFCHAGGLALAESCTGGLVGKLVTDVPGSSAWFDRGLITYSYASKQELLGVPPEILAEDGPGAVSEPCVVAMARGVLTRSDADCALAISGVAGLVVALWGIEALVALLPSELVSLTTIGLDVRLLAIAAVVTLATGVASGILPAAFATRRAAKMQPISILRSD